MNMMNFNSVFKMDINSFFVSELNRKKNHHQMELEKKTR